MVCMSGLRVWETGNLQYVYLFILNSQFSILNSQFSILNSLTSCRIYCMYRSYTVDTYVLCSAKGEWEFFGGTPNLP